MDERVSMRKDAEQIVIKNINAANPASDRDDGERTGGGEAVCSPAGFTGREQEAMRDVLDLAMNMGRVLLKNGAEIFRVEETIEHVCRRFHIKDVESFVMSNGIFMTARDEAEEVYAKVKHIPISGFHLGIVTEVNDLSREIAAGKVGLEMCIRDRSPAPYCGCRASPHLLYLILIHSYSDQKPDNHFQDHDNVPM